MNSPRWFKSFTRAWLELATWRGRSDADDLCAEVVRSAGVGLAASGSYSRAWGTRWCDQRKTGSSGLAWQRAMAARSRRSSSASTGTERFGVESTGGVRCPFIGAGGGRFIPEFWDNLPI